MDDFEHSRQKERIAAPGSFFVASASPRLKLGHWPAVLSKGARAHSRTHDRRYGLGIHTQEAIMSRTVNRCCCLEYYSIMSCKVYSNGAWHSSSFFASLLKFIYIRCQSNNNCV